MLGNLAKPKTNVIIKVIDKKDDAILFIWGDNIAISDIESVEGVSSAVIYNSLPFFVSIDPNYDAHEVAAELEMLLSSEVPNIFYE